MLLRSNCIEVLWLVDRSTDFCRKIVHSKDEKKQMFRFNSMHIWLKIMLGTVCFWDWETWRRNTTSEGKWKQSCFLVNNVRIRGHLHQPLPSGKSGGPWRAARWCRRCRRCDGGGSTRPLHAAARRRQPPRVGPWRAARRCRRCDGGAAVAVACGHGMRRRGDGDGRRDVYVRAKPVTK